MKTFLLTLLAGCACAYPYPYYPYYSQNFDAVSVGGNQGSPNTMVLSRYYQPYEPYRPSIPQGMNGGMAAFLYGARTGSGSGSSEYMVPVECKSCGEPLPQYLPPQEVVQTPETNEIAPARKPADVSTPPPEVIDEATESVTARVTPTLEDVTSEVEELEEVTPKPTPKPSKRRVTNKKQIIKSKPEEGDEDEEFVPRMPMNAYFPMFFGSYPGQRAGNSGGGPQGATAIANAYSTGRGGVATSHATAYGGPRPDTHR